MFRIIFVWYVVLSFADYVLVCVCDHGFAYWSCGDPSGEQSQESIDITGSKMHTIGKSGMEKLLWH